MLTEALRYLYDEFDTAVRYCDRVCRENSEEGFPPEEVPEHFATDVFALAHYVMSAVGEVTPRKVEIVNELFPDICATDLEASKDAVAYIRSQPTFEIPMSAGMVTLKEFLESQEDPMAMEQALLRLQKLLHCYAVIMCATATADTPLADKELETILEVLQNCCAHMESVFHREITLSQGTMDLVYDAWGENHE